MNDQKITIIRVYTDDNGKSNFGSVDIMTNLVDFAPPAPKVFLTKPTEAKQSFFLAIPPKWFDMISIQLLVNSL